MNAGRGPSLAKKKGIKKAGNKKLTDHPGSSVSYTKCTILLVAGRSIGRIVEFLDPCLEKEGNGAISPVVYLLVRLRIVLVELADSYCVAVFTRYTQFLRGRVRSGDSLSPTNPGASWV